MVRIEAQIAKVINQHKEIKEHSLRVFFLAYQLLINLPDDYFNSQQKCNILVAALLHDIGKGIWPEEWLIAPRNQLSERVWQSMQMHPVIGSELLKSLGFNIQEVLDIIIQHHEKSDGTGYPDGVTPSKEAKFLSVCDALIGSTEPRSYREPLSVPEAIKQKDIDPVVMSVIKKLSKEV